MNEFLISIVTVVYNGEKHIRPTLNSVLSQTFRNHIEYIVIDGASRDATLDILSEHAHKIDHLLSEKDQGVYDAMNKGIQLASGEYILFLNAGDQLSSPKLIEDIFTNIKSADIIYGETNIIHSEGSILGSRTELTSRKLPNQLKKEDFLSGQVVSHQSFIVKKKLCPPYDLKYKCSADIDWMLKIISNSSYIIKYDGSIANYLQGGISDRHLWKCWKERFFILLDHFKLVEVVRAHIKFAIRFLFIGKYKKTSHGHSN